MCTRPMAQFFALLASRVVAAPERALAIRSRRAPFLRPFYSTDAVCYPRGVAVAPALVSAGPGPPALRQLS
jgi:hypothetical protein